MKKIFLIVILFVSLPSFGQVSNVVHLDSTQITLIGNKLYKAYQGYQKNKDELTNTVIQYAEVDISNVLFKKSQSVLLPGSYNALNALVILMRNNPQLTLKIEGHTDKIGHSRSNLKLSIRRARAIRLYLFSKNIKLERVTAIGHGDTNPICDAPCKENQRVTFTLIDDGTEKRLVTRMSERMTTEFRKLNKK